MPANEKESKIEDITELKLDDNLVQFFALLLKVDRRNNPEYYKDENVPKN